MSRVAKCCVFVACALAICAAQAWADPIAVGSGDYTGTRSTGTEGGVTGNSTWASCASSASNCGFEISWEITDNSDGTWTYSYTISAEGGEDLTGDLSHWILELTSGVDWSGVDWDDGQGTAESGGPTTHDGGSSGNPGMPDDIYGIKWEPDPSVASATFTFTVSQAPVWGDFYAKDGKQNGEFAYAYNTGFGTDPTSSTTDFTGWIARPNGATAVIPEPGTIALFGMGLATLGVGLRRRRRSP